MGRIRSLLTVLAMLMGGAALALIAGAILYAWRRATSPDELWKDGVEALGDERTAALAAAEAEAAAEAHRERETEQERETERERETAPVAVAVPVEPSPPAATATTTSEQPSDTVEAADAAIAPDLLPPDGPADSLAGPGSPLDTSSPTDLRPAVTERPFVSAPAPTVYATEPAQEPRGALWWIIRVLAVLVAALLGVLVGLLIFIATGGTLG